MEEDKRVCRREFRFVQKRLGGATLESKSEEPERGC